MPMCVDISTYNAVWVQEYSYMKMINTYVICRDRYRIIRSVFVVCSNIRIAGCNGIISTFLFNFSYG